jgi:hypothetical protein
MVKTRKATKAKAGKKFADGDGESRSTSFASRSQFDAGTLKQLAEDIEYAGGIKEFDKGLTQGLNLLLDLRTYVVKEGEADHNIYGERGSKLRERIRKKVAKWKSKSPEEYLLTLSKLGVLPASARKKENISKLVPGIAKIPKKVQIVEDIVDQAPPVARSPAPPARSWLDDDIQRTIDRLDRFDISSSSKKKAPAPKAPALKKAPAPKAPALKVAFVPSPTKVVPTVTPKKMGPRKCSTLHGRGLLLSVVAHRPLCRFELFDRSSR